MRAFRAFLFACVALFMALQIEACAHGSDGVRQACTVNSEALGNAYRVFAVWYAADQAAIRELNKTDPVLARITYEKHEPIARRVLSRLDMASVAAPAYCSNNVFTAIDAGKRKDRAALVVALAALASEIASAMATINAEGGVK